MDDRDAEAFRALYRRHHGTVCRLPGGARERAGVEDVAAETFLVAWRRQAELPDHVVPWLLNTAAKRLANQRRARERSDALIERLGAAIVSGLAIESLPDTTANASSLQMSPHPGATMVTETEARLRSDLANWVNANAGAASATRRHATTRH